MHVHIRKGRPSLVALIDKTSMYQSHSVADYHCNPHHALSTGDHSLRPITYLPEANLYHGRYKYTPDLIQLSLAPNPTPAASWPKYHSPSIWMP